MTTKGKETALLPVILCGGAGSRLWPLSRETSPKQFLALLGERSMLQETVLRLWGSPSQLPIIRPPMLVCNAEHRFLAASQLQEIGVESACILLEPEGRNTAPALTLAALQAICTGEDPVMLAMPADHAIADVNAFISAVEQAFPMGEQGAMVTFGVLADRPETGYGYIQKGECWHGNPAVFHIKGFAEKPDRKRALQYLSTGDHLWNSGLFMVRASVWLHALGHFRADILAACQASMREARRDLDFIRPGVACFEACPSDSIDYAVMERLPGHAAVGVDCCVVPLSTGWSDLGAWNAVWDLQEHDAQGNASMGDVLLQDCADSLFVSSSRLVAGVGLEQIVVVETPDAVLIADKRRTQDVKQMVGKLRNSGHALAQAHRKVYRPWGWYDCLDAGERFQVKRIVVKPGASLSLQMHRHRAEHWVVVKGTAEVTNGEKTYLLGPDQSTYIPVGSVHRLANPGECPLEIIEVQSGAYLGEDDIVRLEDVYGRRAPTNGSDINNG
ncbi:MULTISPECIES: mannose-1-phosphate guanylyltransferase/mannose-6-phosphate isomerase [unclassified Delftia]|uniref:mannose-1-phosphate guanylyltransferase/mannose-6-phosphate isomerase n=1 Tax=unclassified Delftia TaxID=2613839 RepID=UPI0019015CC0|nr:MULTISPECIES: mannose-1-phosphate guanylyltransferase/mannose-6-phosphate isomerase [unclassified Delftia]MBK0111376.1 mannose-1-phosphate guanylyltransferase/mannose-6-phosphate isomerase [Delftia sp. S65]MBK0116805.1 mannose-1-phosphate guanylyltransferase/mannose-6-phosphate isomerase [Delftia sp. S67]MBK0128094.1 mannose-1-phosphate guanylyltransferase/mannose-6-phosphate isomerase [Delftia sp. S66]